MVEEEKEEIPEVPEIQPEVKPTEEWIPKTSLGKEVLEGKIKSIEEIFESGRRILEPEIVDKLVPNLKSELILIGGRSGKGGGIERIPIRITATMHKSGRRFRVSAFAVVGNEDGLVGIGKGSSVEPRDAIEIAIKKAKLNLIKVKRGCGSWECGCKQEHSIPYKTEGKSGSVRVILLPAPNGVGLVASDEAKKILRLAGIKDVWVKTFGNTKMRINLITAIFNALKNLYVYEK
jgi:small subunit ribosomal protein S5